MIVVGAGFAGMAAVEELDRAGAQVLLIDRNVYSTFQPLLYQVATGGLNPGDVSYPARAFTRKHGARFRLGEVTEVDPAHRRVTLADGGHFDYDYLILATGVSAAYYGVSGAAEHSLGLYTRRDAVELRNHIMARLERLDIAGPGKIVNFTVVGGGATGVELAGALAELRSTALDAAFPEVNLASVRIRLVEQADALLLPFQPRLREYARRQLEARGVEVRLNTAIREVRSDRVILADGEDLPSDVTVWAAGVSAPAGVAGWWLPQGRGGRILTGPDLRVLGQDRIFALGDIALIEDQPLPQLAQPGAADRTARGPADPAARRRPACPPVRVPRQGHHGHDRAPVRGGGTAAPDQDPGHARLAGVAGPAPAHPAGQPQPPVGHAQPVLAVSDLGPRRRRDRRRRSGAVPGGGAAAGRQ